MTDIQQHQQCDGPHRPTVRQFQFILTKIPHHLEIRAISINGQGNQITVEVYHEGITQEHKFETSDFYDIV